MLNIYNFLLEKKFRKVRSDDTVPLKYLYGLDKEKRDERKKEILLFKKDKNHPDRYKKVWHTDVDKNNKRYKTKKGEPTLVYNKVFEVKKKEELPQDINSIIKLTLKLNGFNNYYKYFKNNLGTLPLIANLLNNSAKTINSNLYEYKPILIKYLCLNHNKTWGKNGIVYCETPLGQVSFHVFDNEDKLANKYNLSNYKRKWDKTNLQDKALYLINKYVEELNESILLENKSLDKKSKKTKISLVILKEVYKRGLAAWGSGHRPGVTQEQWANGRVNSFITGVGEARKADSDLWDKVPNDVKSNIDNKVKNK